MNAYTTRLTKWALGILLALPCVALSAQSDASKKPALAASTNALPTWATVEIPLSVFVIPSNPKEGRNPFFPQAVVAAPIIKPTEVVGSDAFVLNGITSPPKRTAMINGSTFEVGEEHEIKLPGGSRIMVKCVEIRADSAIILSGGVRRELRLRFGL
jgi:hypothetical protein